MKNLYFFGKFQLYGGVCVRIWTLRFCSTDKAVEFWKKNSPFLIGSNPLANSS